MEAAGETPDVAIGSVELISLTDAIRAPSEEPRAEASDSSGSTSTQVKTTSLSAERRCTVLLEVPSDFDPGHPAVDGEPSSYYDPQPGITSGHTDQPNIVKQSSDLTLPTEFDFAFRLTMPNKPRIKDARALQAGSSTQTAVLPRRPPVPTTSQAKATARPKTLTRSRPDDVDADRAPKRSRSYQSNVASPARTLRYLYNPPRPQEVRPQKQSTNNSRPASSGFQSRLNQWREVEARQSTSSIHGSLSHSVQSRNIPEWQDVSLVYHALPVKDHSRSRKPMMSFGLDTEKRILERENWEQTTANMEKIEAEVRAQEEFKALKMEHERFIGMSREYVVKADPVPHYLKKSH
ncbi:hypothetical protein MJO28_013685 [Puccinia striiformis f. sp. tritici]|uniref:Uncharacterized protein n=1 Tax=Puccinia striiformis f. sp. tritici TaxID=168172 RepID=A0ACC0DWJ3_9BASI|nr:hypothetical protein MJO28_013685 [Puccinia striiformis f. sp. tritici]KAI7941449.1 hypothetical protein MJO29_013523 [Puccinia striiformis f. sp. tritici]